MTRYKHVGKQRKFGLLGRLGYSDFYGLGNFNFYGLGKNLDLHGLPAMYTQSSMCSF